MLKMLKVFRICSKKVLKTGETLKTLKMLKVFWGIDPPPPHQKKKKCLKLGKC